MLSAKAEAIPIIVRTTAMGFAKRSTHLICARRANQFVGGLCLCPVPFEKIFLFFRTPNQNYMIRHLVPLDGRIAIVTNAGRDAVDVRASGAPWQSQGEMNLVSGQLACKMIGA